MAYLSISKLNKLDDSALRKEVAREIKHTNQMLRRIDAKGITSKAVDNLRRRIDGKYISTKGKSKAELLQIIRDVRQFKKAKGHNVSGIKAINKTRAVNIKNRTKRKTVYNQRSINNSANDTDNVIDVDIDNIGDIWDDYGTDHYMEYIQQNYPEFYNDFLKALEKYPELNYDTNFIYYNNDDIGTSAREMGELIHEEMRVHVGRIIRSMKDAHQNTTGRDWSQFSEI